MSEREPEQQDAIGQEHGSEGQSASERETNRLEPRIYAASLSDYNAGILHGGWLDADDDIVRMHGEIDAMLARLPTARREGAPAEEWAIHDYEGFAVLHLDEYAGLTTVTRLAAGIRENGFAAWASLTGAAETARHEFEDAYLGHWDSRAQYAEELLDDLGIESELDRAVPDGLRPYVQIDYEGFARDWCSVATSPPRRIPMVEYGSSICTSASGTAWGDPDTASRRSEPRRTS